MTLSIEQKATNFETCQHIQKVQEMLHKFIRELLDRGEKHDQSKLETPEVEAFTEFTPKLAGSTYGSQEYNDFKKAMGPALVHHYAKNRHHPEYQRQNEEWRPIVGFEEHYEVSNYGDVRSKDRIVERSKTGDCFKAGKIRTQYVTPKGYCRLQLQSGENRRNALVHVLVAEAFLPNPENKPEVNHKNGEKTDNRVSNLEWVTNSENLLHAYATGLKEATIKYVVTCEKLEITTFGCLEMEAELKKRGYERANASGIWRCINHGGKHLDLEFVGTRFERWMNSPINDMNLVDLIEMFCDWKAATMRHHDGNLLKSIKINAERFGINPQLVKILENTADLFDTEK